MPFSIETEAAMIAHDIDGPYHNPKKNLTLKEGLLNNQALAIPQNLTLTYNAAGSLAPDTYYYGVTAVHPAGESLRSERASLKITATGSIDLNWDSVEGATSYRVYGRDGYAWYFIAEVTSTSFNDDGSITPTTQKPPETAIGGDIKVSEGGHLVFEGPFDANPAILIKHKGGHRKEKGEIIKIDASDSGYEFRYTDYIAFVRRAIKVFKVDYYGRVWNYGIIPYEDLDASLGLSGLRWKELFVGAGATSGFMVDSSGLMKVGDVASLPTASADYRGKMALVLGASGVADGLYICLKSSADTYNWVQISVG